MPKLPEVPTSSQGPVPPQYADAIARALSRRSRRNDVAYLGTQVRRYFAENSDARQKFIKWFEALP